MVLIAPQNFWFLEPARTLGVTHILGTGKEEQEKEKEDQEDEKKRYDLAPDNNIENEAFVKGSPGESDFEIARERSFDDAQVLDDSPAPIELVGEIELIRREGGASFAVDFVGREGMTIPQNPLDEVGRPAPFSKFVKTKRDLFCWLAGADNYVVSCAKITEARAEAQTKVFCKLCNRFVDDDDKMDLSLPPFQRAQTHFKETHVYGECCRKDYFLVLRACLADSRAYDDRNNTRCPDIETAFPRTHKQATAVLSFLAHCGDVDEPVQNALAIFFCAHEILYLASDTEHKLCADFPDAAAAARFFAANGYTHKRGPFKCICELPLFLRNSTIAGGNYYRVLSREEAHDMTRAYRLLHGLEITIMPDCIEEIEERLLGDFFAPEMETSRVMWLGPFMINCKRCLRQ